MPTQNHWEILLQRLGYPDLMFQSFLNEEDFIIIAFYDTHMSNIEEALRTEPMVLYNLSKYLGLEGRYDECIAICDRGIKLAQVTGRCSCLSQTLYNKAWALVKRKGAGDREPAMKAATRAYNVAEALDNQHLTDHIRKFIEDNQFL